jgi:hypothetical protein
MDEENEERTNERALLLMHFYWRDDIYKIYKELNTSYFFKINSEIIGIWIIIKVL